VGRGTLDATPIARFRAEFAVCRGVFAETMSVVTPNTSGVRTRSCARLMAAVLGVLVVTFAVGLAPPRASAESVQAPIYDGVNRFEVGIPQDQPLAFPLDEAMPGSGRRCSAAHRS
jgi:hypothetical protein